MKRFTKLILSIAALFSLPLLSLTSCSGFFKTDVVMIEDIIATTLADGNIELTITFTDDAHEPISVIVPQGKTGNGIESITQTPNEENNSTTITITYTDETMEPLTFEVYNGVNIVSVEESVDPETGDNVLTVTLSDGSSQQFIIPKGDKGEDGTSITGVSQSIDEKTGDIILNIHYSDPDQEDSIVRIPMPKDGEDGRGITSVTFTQEGNQYVITFNFTDSTSSSIAFDKPASWYSGNTNPNDGNVAGVEGDFYFNQSQYTIYKYTNGTWVLIADLDDRGLTETYNVSFKLNDTSDEPAQFVVGQAAYENIPNGRYFAALGYQVPIASRDGYEFMGWYTSQTYNVTLGAFTDMTPIYSDLTLYARWEQIIA